MQDSSLVKHLHTERINLPTLTTKLAGLEPALFDKEVKPLRELIESHETSEEATDLLLNDNVTHHHADDMYARELLLPKGTVVLSRVHLQDGINIISKGHVVIVDTHGRVERQAPCTFVSKAGTQRLVYCVEETVWTLVHATHTQDPTELFDELTVETYEDYINQVHQLTHKE